MFDLSARTALVTGAGQNTGAGIARALARQGAHVVVNDLVEDRAEATASAIERAGGRASVAAFDTTDRSAAAAAADRHGPIDILVNNAGNGGAARMVPTPFKDMDPADWAGPIEVNLFGVLNCCHAVIGGMVERGWGRIVTIASGAGTRGVGIGVAPYSAGKGGSVGFMRSLALETAASGVTCNSVALGLMAHTMGGAATEKLARAIPVGRGGTGEDAGAICVYLCSDEASWVTAQTIHLDGGATPT